jgi:hypothetical protein
VTGYVAGYTPKGGDTVHAMKDDFFALCGVRCNDMSEPFQPESPWSCQKCVSATTAGAVAEIETPFDSTPAIRALDGAVEEIAALRSLIRRMAERFDGGHWGKCTWCGAGRAPGVWEFHGVEPGEPPRHVPEPCTNSACGSHDIRSILNAER